MKRPSLDVMVEVTSSNSASAVLEQRSVLRNAAGRQEGAPVIPGRRSSLGRGLTARVAGPGEDRSANWIGALFVALGLGCSQTDGDSAPALAAERVLYGADDRIELLRASETVQERAAGAVVALIPEARLRVLPSGETLVDTESLSAAHGLCDGVRFSEQPSAATCTGTLVTDRLVLTAHHCVTNDDHCRSLRWVFGYQLRSNGSLGPFAKDDVYSCGRIAAASFDREEGIDVAWIELDRPVAARHPIELTRERPALEPGTRLIAVGFGQGLPAKVDPDVRVLDASVNYFTASADAFVGSSGMPVFDSSLTLVGFSVRGEDDYERVGDCQIPRVLDVGCKDCSLGGERISYIGPALDVLERSLGGSGAGGAPESDSASSIAGAGGAGGRRDASLAVATHAGVASHELSRAGAGTADRRASDDSATLSGGARCGLARWSGPFRDRGRWPFLLVAGLVGARRRRGRRWAQNASGSEPEPAL